MAGREQGTEETVRRASVARRDMLLWLAAGLSGLSAGARAQTPDSTPGAGPPSLKLSPAQRQLIYASISSRTHTSTAAPPNFGASIGGHLPEAVQLAPLPETIIEVVPQLRGHAYAFVGGQVLIVEPTARRIVEVIAASATERPARGPA